jgi:hypothetical protein
MVVEVVAADRIKMLEERKGGGCLLPFSFFFCSRDNPTLGTPCLGGQVLQL